METDNCKPTNLLLLNSFCLDVTLTLEISIHLSSVLIAFPDNCVSRARVTPSAKLLTRPLTNSAAAAFKTCPWFQATNLSSHSRKITGGIGTFIITTKVKKLTSASAMAPFSPDNTRLSTSALYLGSPPRKLSRVQRGIPNSTVQYKAICFYQIE